MFVLALVLYGAVVFAVFTVGYGLRWRRWWPFPTGRQLMAMAASLAFVLGSLLAVGLRWPVPMWVFATGFLALDLMGTGWLVLLVRTRGPGTE